MRTITIDENADDYHSAERRFIRKLQEEAAQGKVDRQRKEDAEMASIETAEELHRLYQLLNQERQARLAMEKDAERQKDVEKRRFIFSLAVSTISAVAAVIAAVVAVITLFHIPV